MCYGFLIIDWLRLGASQDGGAGNDPTETARIARGLHRFKPQGDTSELGRGAFDRRQKERVAMNGADKRAKRSKSRPEDARPVLPDTKGDLFWEMNEPGAKFKQSVVGIVVVRADGTIGYINPYLASLVGDLPADMLNEPLLDFVAEQDRAAIAEVVKDCVSGKRQFVQLESTVTHKNGTIVDIFIDATAAIFEGQPAAVGAVIDISERKQAELALADSEAKLQTALTNMSQGLAMLDSEGGMVLFNRRFAEIFLLSQDQILPGMTLPEIIGLATSQSGVGDLDPEGTMAQIEKVLRGTETGSFIVRLSDGRSIADTYRPMPGGGMVVTFEDITDRRQAEQALADSEAKLQTALSNMSQGLLMLDTEGKLVLHNSRLEEIYGLPPEVIKEGMAVPELMALGVSATGVEDMNPEATLAQLAKVLGDPAGGTYVQRLNDGRSISESFQPMPEGGVVVTFEDITQRLADQAEIQHMAQFDALTELPNRVSFYDQLDTVMKHQRPGEFVGVLSLDLDHFKAVNDTLGHPTGDLLLQAAARRMQSCLRGEDIPARLGGDEFAIIQTPVKDPSDITALASRLIEVVSAPYDLDGRQVIVGISIGVAVAPSDGTDPDVLMKNADLALYRAKADGGNVYRFFEHEMDARMQARRLIELDLRKAIHNGGEFELLYQPMVDVKTGTVDSCEALLRWFSPERGLVMPDQFIPVAEATGLIVPLGEWVLYHACVEAALWPEEISVSVNLSPAQFKSKKLVRSIKNALAESGLPADRLELEITEQVLMKESEGAFVILRQIRDLGVRISMDDFGTGYSSIGYLRAFPFSKIKIDKSFIRDLPGRKDSIAIVRAVVALSSSLGILTTAEGVETKEQYASVTTEGCNLVQGNFFSEPRPSAEVVQFFKKRFHEDS